MDNSYVNCNTLLHRFVVNEINLGHAIPQEVSDFLLNGHLPHINPSPFDPDNEHFNNFLIKFEQFVLNQKDKKNFCSKAKIVLNNTNEERNSVELLLRKKYNEVEKLVINLKAVITLKEDIEKLFDGCVSVESIQRDVDELKQKVFKKNVESYILNETRRSLEAMKKLRNLIEVEKKDMNIRLLALEDKNKEYNAIENVIEFTNLLVSYKKLIARKEQLTLDKTN